MTTQAGSQLTMIKDYTDETVQENIKKHTSEVKFARKECKKLHSTWEEWPKMIASQKKNSRAEDASFAQRTLQALNVAFSVSADSSSTYQQSIAFHHFLASSQFHDAAARKPDARRVLDVRKIMTNDQRSELVAVAQVSAASPIRPRRHKTTLGPWRTEFPGTKDSAQ